MRIQVRTGSLVRLVAGSVAGLLVAVGMFSLLLHLVDVPVTVTRPAVKAPIIPGPVIVCQCGPVDPWRVRLSRVEIDLPPLHELLTPLKSLVGQETFTDDLVDLQIPLDVRLVD